MLLLVAASFIIATQQPIFCMQQPSDQTGTQRTHNTGTHDHAVESATENTHLLQAQDKNHHQTTHSSEQDIPAHIIHDIEIVMTATNQNNSRVERAYRHIAEWICHIGRIRLLKHTTHLLSVPFIRKALPYAFDYLKKSINTNTIEFPQAPAEVGGIVAVGFCAHIFYDICETLYLCLQKLSQQEQQQALSR